MRILLLDNIGLAGCIGPEQGAAPVQGNSRTSPMPNVASPISAFLSLKAVATDLITLKLIRIFQFTSILSIFVQPCR